MANAQAGDKSLVKTIAMILDKYATVQNVSYRNIARNSGISDVVLRRVIRVWKNDLEDSQISFKAKTAIAMLKDVVRSNQLVPWLAEMMDEFLSTYGDRPDMIELVRAVEDAKLRAEVHGKPSIMIDGVIVVADVRAKSLKYGGVELRHAPFNLDYPIPSLDLQTKVLSWYGIPLQFGNPAPKEVAEEENLEVKKLQQLLAMQKQRGTVSEISARTVAFLYLDVQYGTVLKEYNRVHVTDRMSVPDMLDKIHDLSEIETIRDIIVIANSHIEEKAFIEAVVNFWRANQYAHAMHADLLRLARLTSLNFVSVP